MNSNEWAVLLTAIATIFLAIVGGIQIWILLRQTKIQKTQTDIQNNALDRTLLEQRLKCFGYILDAKAFFQNTNSIGSIYASLIFPNNNKESIQNLDKNLSGFISEVRKSKYLFSEYQYEKLNQIVPKAKKYSELFKEYIFCMEFLRYDVDEKKPEALKIKNSMIELIKDSMQTNTIDMIKFLKLFPYRCTEEMIKLIEQIQKEFDDEEFFNSFDKYLNINKI